MAYRRSWQRDFDRSIREHPDWPVVVSQGDSWFSNPHEKSVIDFLDEPVHAIQLAGAALVLVGVTLVTLQPRPAAAPPGAD